MSESTASLTSETAGFERSDRHLRLVPKLPEGSISFSDLVRLTAEADLRDAIVNLYKLKVELAEPNWDGYGAKPINEQAVEQAAYFLSNLPYDIPMPSIGADPDGEVSFEWENSAGHILSISVSEFGMLTFARQSGTQSRSRGRELMKESIPDVILCNIRMITSCKHGTAALSVRPLLA